VRELRRAVRELGFVALRVVPWLWGLPPNDRRYYPLYVECVELGVPFCTQVGRPSWWPTWPATPAASLACHTTDQSDQSHSQPMLINSARTVQRPGRLG
jgi:predicted TIM-barrel fold metal-dependent hydrolase